MRTEGPTRTIRVVEDEEYVRMIAVDVLEDEGYRILQAADAGQALAILASQCEIDMLFTDVNIPGDVDGLGVAARAVETRPSLRLIVSSGREYFSNRALPDDGHFLPKPYTPSELRGAVNQLW
jgi:CheY-like chemotaxis protein